MSLALKVLISLIVLGVCYANQAVLQSDLPENARNFLGLDLSQTSEVMLQTKENIVSFYKQEDYKAIEEGDLGNWLGITVFPDGYYACGMVLRDEAGKWESDDSANNAIKLIACQKNDWNSQLTFTLNEGIWGSWKSPVMCNYGGFITSIRVKYEKYELGQDNTTMNGLEFKCSGNSGVKSMEYGGWGDWRDWVDFSDHYICGGQVRFDQDMNKRDQTALNGLAVKLCSRSYKADDYTSIDEGPWGEWLDARNGPNGYFACGIQLRHQDYQGSGDDTAINAIRIIYCQYNNWEMKLKDNLNEGTIGEWKEALMCPEDQYIYSVQVKNAAPRGYGVTEPYDDISINQLKFACKHPKTYTNPNLYTVSGFEYNPSSDNYGTWVGFEDKFVCGGRVRFDTSPSWEDETGVSGLRLKFCDFTRIPEDYVTVLGDSSGDWTDPIKIKSFQGFAFTSEGHLAVLDGGPNKNYNMKWIREKPVAGEIIYTDWNPTITKLEIYYNIGVDGIRYFRSTMTVNDINWSRDTTLQASGIICEIQARYNKSINRFDGVRLKVCQIA